MALTDAQRRLLRAAKQAGRQLGERGRELTSVIGELSACELADLTWEPSNGYDARCGRQKVQIKTRKSWSTPGVNTKGRLGRFGRKKGYLFDVAMYVELNDNFDTAGLWRMGVEGVKVLEDKEHSGKGLHVGTFIKQAKQVFTS